MTRAEQTNLRVVLLKDITPGSEVKLAGLDWIVLEQRGMTTALITKNSVADMEYGDSGDWRTSKIRDYLNGEFYSKLAEDIGAINIFSHTVDLQADDGTGKGEGCIDKISLLTTSAYRQYREFLPGFGRWWWLATRPTYGEDYSRCACCANSGGILNWDGVGCRGCVRPFCVLNSYTLTA